MVRRRLMDMAVSADEIASLSFQDTIREAARVGLVDEPVAWFDYRTVRNKTSHAYQEEYARDAYAAAKAFLGAGKRVLERLQQ